MIRDGMTFDARCLELAKDFLVDTNKPQEGYEEADQERVAYELATRIQAVIEQFLEEKGLS